MRPNNIFKLIGCALFVVLCGMVHPQDRQSSGSSETSPLPSVTSADEATLVKINLLRAEVQTIRLPDPAEDRHEVAITVSLDGVEHTLVLHPHSMRDPDFRLLVQVEGGDYVDTPAPAARTYRGHVAGVEGSKVAASLSDDQVYAAIFLPGHEFYWTVQPLSVPQPEAPRSAHLVFRSADTKDGPWRCGTRHAPQPSFPPPAGGGTDGPGLMKVCEIAVDSDFEFYLANGQSVPNTVFDIEDIMNRMETLYEVHSGIRITYEVTAVIVRSSPVDDYASGEPVSLLNEFQAKWNNTMQDVRRDVAHLMTGAPNGLIIGIAYVGVVCNLPSAYGLSYSRFSTNLILRTCLTAHEVGHNWSANHCDGQGDCGIMCSAIGSCSGNCQLFGVSSVNEIAAYRNSVGCLTNEPAPLALPLLDSFPSLTLNSSKWIYNDGATVSSSAGNEPSPPYSLTLISAGPGPHQQDDVRSHFILAAGADSNGGTFRLRYQSKTDAISPGAALVVDYWNNNLTWIEINRIASSGGGDLGPSLFTPWDHVLPADAKHNELRVRFRTENSSATDNWYVDDVFVGVVIPCPADATGDNVVNVNDLLLVINSWGPCPDCPADLTGDDIVNVNDLLMVINNWGPCP